MRVDLNKQILQLDGTPVKSAAGPEAPTVTVKEVVVAVLMATPRPQDPTSGKEKLKKYKLAQRILAAGDQPVSLDKQEIEFIEAAVNNSPHGPLIVGRVWETLNDAEKE